MSSTKLLILPRHLDRLADALGRDLSLRALHSLAVIVAAGESGIDPLSLSEATGSSSATTSRNIRILGDVHYSKEHAGLGLVKAEIDPHDNRRRVLRATPEARKLLQAFVDALSR